MADYKMDVEELQQFFGALDEVSLFRFAARFNDLDREDRVEVLRLFELGYSCSFFTYPDLEGVTTWTVTETIEAASDQLELEVEND